MDRRAQRALWHQLRQLRRGPGAAQGATGHRRQRPGARLVRCRPGLRAAVPADGAQADRSAWPHRAPGALPHQRRALRHHRPLGADRRARSQEHRRSEHPRSLSQDPSHQRRSVRQPVPGRLRDQALRRGQRARRWWPLRLRRRAAGRHVLAVLGRSAGAAGQRAPRGDRSAVGQDLRSRPARRLALHRARRHQPGRQLLRLSGAHLHRRDAHPALCGDVALGRTSSSAGATRSLPPTRSKIR